MRSWIFGRPARAASFVGSVFGFVACLAAACTTAEGDPAARGRQASSGDATGPLVLELFTSQGCSSCPPADRVLSELGAAGALAGRPVIPLAFHVDYWNDLGWADPFSSAEWSARQQRYAGALGEDGVYTPQLVIAGRAHVIGSDRRKIAARAATVPSTRALTAAAAWHPRAVTVTTAERLGGAELWAVIWQDGLATEVVRGENRGEALRNDRVVRRLVKLDRDGSATIPLDPSWKTVGGAVLAQRPGDRAILGAGLLPAAPAPRI